MKILVTGRQGQVGSELAKALLALGEVIALGRADMDIADPAQIASRVRAARPDLIVNAAAYTGVDKAESDKDAAFLVNALAPGVLAAEARSLGALLVHYSTDYVFDGTKTGPYDEIDTTNPLSVYGESKLAGEHAIEASGCRHLILRTAWVYAGHGKNFVLTMLRLARARAELRVVDDQRGAPTWAHDIAAVTADLCRKASDAPSGIYHLTAEGETTWCGLAREILRQAGINTPVTAITSDHYPSPARRPKNSVLSNSKLRNTFGVRLPEWRQSLGKCLQQLHTT